MQRFGKETSFCSWRGQCGLSTIRSFYIYKKNAQKKLDTAPCWCISAESHCAFTSSHLTANPQTSHRISPAHMTYFTHSPVPAPTLKLHAHTSRSMKPTSQCGKLEAGGHNKRNQSIQSHCNTRQEMLKQTSHSTSNTVHSHRRIAQSLPRPNPSSKVSPSLMHSKGRWWQYPRSKSKRGKLNKTKIRQSWQTLVT